MGRELDVEIGVNVFGWVWRRYDPSQGKGCWLEGPQGSATEGRSGCQHWDGRKPTYNDCLPHYSTDIAAAWEVVEKVCGDQYDYVFRLERLTGRRAPGRYWAHFNHQSGRNSGAYAEEAPEAICKAALKALGVEVPQGEG